MFTAVAALIALPSAPAAPSPAADSLFKPTGPVPVIRITVDEANLKMLRQDDRKPVRATLKVDGGETLVDVGLHLKGAAGSKQSWDAKPGLTLNTDKFTKGQTFRGMDKFHLNNGAQDGSLMHELLANELAASIGLPSCRCGHAVVELNGRKMGLYVLKEGFDKSWLERNFADPSGNLYDGGFCREIDQDLALSNGTDNGHKDIKAVVKACQEKDPVKRYAAVEKVVDVDRFASYMAFEIICCDWDGYPRNRNNYRIYFDPKVGNKAVWVPHGMDQMWQNPSEGLWPGVNGMVARAITESPEGRKKVIARLNEISKKEFTAERFAKRVDELLPRAKDALEKVDKGAVAGYEGNVKALKERIKQRTEHLAKELPKLK